MMKIKLETLLGLVKSKQKGAHMNVAWRKPLKTLKNVSELVEKSVNAVVRAGIQYDNRAVVQDKRASGELPAENQGLPYGEWVDFPYHMHHKGNDYIRFYPASMELPMEVKYFLNGVEVAKEKVIPLCYASEFKKSTGDCFFLKAQYITSLG